LRVLTGDRFARAIRAGALAVVREQETLNRINVFPVPDADTGNNLAATVRSAAAALQAPGQLAIGQTARRAADAALDGARGNSGAIFAQFLHGLAEALGSHGRVSMREFAVAVKRGAEAARQALAQPVEGTILTVMHAWSVALEEQAGRAHDFKELLSHGFARAQEALANTPKQLAVLAKNNVVDAGAQGFVYFLAGVGTLFKDRTAASWNRAGLTVAVPTPFAAAHADVDLSFRYCSEGLLSGEWLDRKAIARVVAPLGNSLVVAGGGSRLRVHIHTNEPQRLFALLATFGELERTKVDDMVHQQLAGRKARFALVTDTGCDLPEATAHALGVVRVPLSITIGGETYRDGVDITAPQLYRLVEASPTPPKTSQPTMREFEATYRQLLESHEGVISLHLSAGMSGTYQAALAAARAVDETRVRVVDSRQITGSLGLMLEGVGEALAAGQDLEQAEATARRLARDTKMFTVIGSLDTAVKGGRVPPSMALMAKYLRLSPVITLDEEHGKAAKVGARLGYRAAVRSLVKHVAAFSVGKPERLMVSHANAIGAAEYLAELLTLRFGLPEVPVVNCTNVLAAQVGTGAVAVAVRRAATQKAD
jgi:uncharacterized protein